MSFRRALALVAGSVAVHLAVVACGSADGPIFGQADPDAGAAGAGSGAEPEIAVEACDRVNEKDGRYYAAHSYPDLTPEQIAARVVVMSRNFTNFGNMPDKFTSTVTQFWISDDGMAGAFCGPSGVVDSVTFILR